MPSISVIIPAYNAARYLVEAITSVLAQTTPPQEIIVVDDGSTDQTGLIAQSFADKVRYLRTDNRGNGAARNLGIAVARGELLAFIDADDLWLPQKLAVQLAALAGNEALDAVFAQVRQFISPELDVQERARLQIKQEVSEAPHVGAMLIRRAALARVGLFVSDQRRAVFIDWYGRAVEANLQHLVVPQVLMHRRLHLDNLGRRERQHQLDYVRTAKLLLDRRRQQGTASAIAS